MVELIKQRNSIYRERKDNKRDRSYLYIVGTRRMLFGLHLPEVYPEIYANYR